MNSFQESNKVLCAQNDIIDVMRNCVWTVECVRLQIVAMSSHHYYYLYDKHYCHCVLFIIRGKFVVLWLSILCCGPDMSIVEIFGVNVFLELNVYVDAWTVIV